MTDDFMAKVRQRRELVERVRETTTEQIQKMDRESLLDYVLALHSLREAEQWWSSVVTHSLNRNREEERRPRSQGGKKSKRPPGPLRLVLLAISDEIQSTDTDEVLTYWENWTDYDGDLKTEAGPCYLEFDPRQRKGEYRFNLNDSWQSATKENIRKSLSRNRRSQIST